MEYQRNRERYEFLRWGQTAFNNFRVVLSGTGICHQVNLEYLARSVWSEEKEGELWAYLDTLVRSEEHTSELQSRPHLVCRLLLEKKNTLARALSKSTSPQC